MSLRHAVLGVLLPGPLHGYAVRAALDERIGDFWPINHGQVYATLERLRRDGWVATIPDEAGDRRRFTLTERGRHFFTDWLREPGQTGRGDGLGFDDFLARLVVCQRQGDIELSRRTIEAQQRRCALLRDRLPIDDARPAISMARALLAAELDWLEQLAWELLDEPGTQTPRPTPGTRFDSATPGNGTGERLSGPIRAPRR